MTIAEYHIFLLYSQAFALSLIFGIIRFLIVLEHGIRVHICFIESGIALFSVLEGFC